ncbi:MAG: NADPH-dependent 7-cyano-7-deazaguanine reductase QueF [Candidatus Riflebacteria bacterium]|nr:NADPH-dependent 7-cyano-7-deazaguanine reductase QueF [Candidatus Riflebacteria bacterium]
MKSDNQKAIDEIAKTFLGKRLNNYESRYDSSLLVPIERSLNRTDYNIKADDFMGFDIWHNYECSFMTNKGYPLTLVGKIKIPADSKYFIESKSMKLYFFGFHMEKLGETKEEAIHNYIRIVRRDLSEKAESNVEFNVFEKTDNIDIFTDYKHIEELIDIETIDFKDFKESPELIKTSNDKGTLKVSFPNLRSNCRVTQQPDFGSLFIGIEGELPSLESLAQYIVSFRNEYHFHEEVTEQIYKSLQDRLKIDKLSVCNMFTRRGGLDICPCRASSLDLIDQTVIDINRLQNATVYQ